jgi:MFS family permease
VTGASSGIDSPAKPGRTVNRWLTLAVACLAVFTVMVAGSIVNVLLPTLTREIDASTEDLLWIVDGFNLVFAALVLAGGSLSDRFGRKGALIAGLAIYAFASTMSAFATNAEALIAWRALAGLGAAACLPIGLYSNGELSHGQRVRACAKRVSD